MTLPVANNIPELDFNYEGLNRHSYLCSFMPDPLNSKGNDRQIRKWLLHTFVTSSRHYSKIRELVVLQNNADQAEDGGVIFHILDLSEQIEGCLSATYRVYMAIRRMSNENTSFKDLLNNQNTAFDKLKNIRNQFEHMHSQIVLGEIGRGPILISLSDFGQVIRFRKLQLEVSSLHDLIKGLYFVIADLYPSFDVKSKPEAGGPVKLSITGNISVTKKNG